MPRRPPRAAPLLSRYAHRSGQLQYAARLQLMTMKWFSYGLMNRNVTDLLCINLIFDQGRPRMLSLPSASPACLRSASEPAARMPALDPGHLRRPRARSC